MKILILAPVTLLVILLAVSPVTATTYPLNLSLPDIKDIHLREGALFTTALNASYVPGIMAWQVNITFNPQAVAAVDYSLGSEWTTAPYISINRTRNSNGYYLCSGIPSPTPCGNVPFIATNHGTILAGFTYFSGHFLTTSETTTMFTVTWKVLSRFAYSDLHIVQSSENRLLGTLLVTPLFHIQSYTTVDGFFSNCNHLPTRALGHLPT